ncbi:hypothetical protein P154DRAFT_446313 [Amniculicola lignicola CBS 123094]|uniref:G domain-containing protein n=1 Tax=Amniculicola lignicola CBS 123094 TaxID=1392246 RepID=A0A6A5W256_9PLEO|nr:hypothetical protein P154DRAFT_446313 [Amniculicola lignicola CBS 123094]
MEDIILIAVMGVTGSGKSNFIRHATGGKGPKVGGDLESCTQTTESYTCTIGTRTVILLDTPGFDDTHRGDADILSEIAETLSAAYKNRIKISGIVYLHRIKDERMTNAIMRNLTMFRKLCGDDAFKNVVLATTFWDEMKDHEKGERREKQLVTERKWWGYMASKGSQIRRFQNSRQSALDIITELAGLPRVSLQIQREMVDDGLTIDHTAAGEALNKELAELAANHASELRKLQEDMEQAIKDRDEDLQKTISEMQDEKREMIGRLENELEALQADRREEMRAMEQRFNDQLHRLEKERRERDEEIDGLEARLARERLDSDSRLQEALARSNNLVTKLTSEMSSARAEDKSRYEKTLRDLKEQQDRSINEGRKWQNEIATANDKIMELTVMQAFARDRDDLGERDRLEGRIRQLEREKEEKEDGFWDMLVPLTTLAISALIL